MLLIHREILEFCKWRGQNRNGNGIVIKVASVCPIKKFHKKMEGSQTNEIKSEIRIFVCVCGSSRSNNENAGNVFTCVHVFVSSHVFCDVNSVNSRKIFMRIVLAFL